ncbi:MAG: alpha/beta hydrolase [Actinobacteria bacterium]|nr:alpha/beta hydrolase [Actinomycetota bacterium]
MAGDLTGGRPGPDAGGAAEVIAVKMVRGVTVETWRFPGSRGDEVHADAYLAAQPGPVVIGGHGKDGDRTAQYLRGPALQWAGRGVSLVSADAPLHGDRAGEAPIPRVTMADPALVSRWLGDQRLLIDAVEARFGRVPMVYLGMSMGAVMGCHLLAEDDRLAGGILVVGGSTVVSVPERLGGAADGLMERLAVTDPEKAAARIAPRPVLMLNADQDEMFSRRSALALYDALGHPKEISFFPGRHARWRDPRQWNRRMWGFVEHTCWPTGRS